MAIGSNLPSEWGDRKRNLELAVANVGMLGRVVAVSPFIDTAPVGWLNQPRFLNGVLILDTGRAPVELLRSLLEIEREMGRDRANVAPKGPRIIDLDLVLYGEVCLSTEELKLPHPEMHRRLFVLEPLAAVRPYWTHPILRRTVAELLVEARCAI